MMYIDLNGLYKQLDYTSSDSVDFFNKYPEKKHCAVFEDAVVRRCLLLVRLFAFLFH